MSTIAEIRDDISAMTDALRKTLQAAEARSALVDARDEESRAKITALDKLIRGNGVEGLVSKVNTLVLSEAHLAKEIVELKATVQKFIWWVIGILTTSLGAMIGFFILRN